jgi:hypothetical protein
MTETYQNISNIVIAVGVVLTALGGYGSYYFGKRLEAEKDAEAKGKEQRLVAQVDNITASAKTLEAKLGPFEKLATTMYPNLKLEAALEKLRQDTADLRRKTEMMERRAAPRVLSDEQKQRFVEFLKAAPKGKVAVYSFMSADPETIEYANKIRDMVIGAGFDSGSMVGMSLGGRVPTGVAITIKNASQQPAHAGAIQQAMALIGTPMDGLVDPSVPDGEVRIIIGLKPTE